MKEEIIGGLRNALDRGESVENAMKSLISAGYNANEVRAAAEELSSTSVSKITSMQREAKPQEPVKILKGKLPKESIETPSANLSEESADNVPQNTEEKSPYDEMIEDKKKKSSLTMKTLLIIMLVILIIAVAASAIFIFFFPDKLPAFIKNIIS